MPTYEYRCPKGHDFERFYKSISAAQGEQDCPECGARAERRLSGGAGLLFKGSGFYLTDYGKNAHRSSAPTKGGGEGGKTEKGADAKPAADSKKAESPAPKAEGSGSKAESPKPKPESKKK